MSALLDLAQHGQSYWIDDLARRTTRGGDLRRRVSDEGLRGVTSNPKTFHTAITSGTDYDRQIVEEAAKGSSAAEIYEHLVVTDVQEACDALRPVYDASNGADGFVSLEVSPYLAYDARGSIEEGRRLARHVGRPNLMIKIPATHIGLEAVEELLFEGVNVNITLLFSVERYQAVAEAYQRALERRRAAARPLDEVHSVASFFLSRIDVLVDKLLEHRLHAPVSEDLDPNPERLLGRVAVANAKLAYQNFLQWRTAERWRVLERAGANVQRLLWASTGSKNPKYSDVGYVEPLIGPDTVTTMPQETSAAFDDHGTVEDTLTRGREDAEQVMIDLYRVGVDFACVCQELEHEGVQKFIEPYAALQETLKEQGLRHPRAVARDVAALEDAARKLRCDVIRMTTAAGSGHPTSCLSCADIVAALFFHQMRWDPSDAEAKDVDRFILSKGHAAPILWAALAEASAIAEDLLTLRRIDSTLEGHPTRRNPWVRVATGSLGQGLACANGIALSNRLDGIDAKVYCLLGDGECSEGSVWEAAQFASKNGLSNVVAIVDNNALAQTGPSPYGRDASVLERRFAAFGFNAVVVDGHVVAAILDALEATAKDAPTAVIARTVKGKGVSFLEGEQGWHGKALDDARSRRAIAEIGGVNRSIHVAPRRVPTEAPRASSDHRRTRIEYEEGETVATRTAFGRALVKLGAQELDLVVLDGDVGDSTRTRYFAERYPERFIQCHIAEQGMAGVALGLASEGKIVIAATFACFLTRAHDFVRMAAHSRVRRLIFCGSHAGVATGQDGPSQMGLEDLALFRALPRSTVLYPSDPVSAECLTEEAGRTDGIVYLRLTRPKTPVLYAHDHHFPVGGSKLLRASARDDVTLVAAGITVHEALAAADLLSARGISARVIDAYSVKPIDTASLRTAARETKNLIVIEDHVPEGGLGDAVAAAVDSAVVLRRLAVRGRSRSGPSHALLEAHGISRRAIVRAATVMLGEAAVSA
jgi:transketolase